MLVFSIWRKAPMKLRIFSFSLLSTSTSRPPGLPKTAGLPYWCKRQAFEAATSALTDYLYSTRSLPHSLAEQISLHSPCSLSAHLSRIKYPSDDFSQSNFNHFFSHWFIFQPPINEFEFFYESIGVSDPKPSDSIYLSDDSRLVEGVSQLIHFGFPYEKLGILYPSQALRVAPIDLIKRINKVENIGLSSRDCVIAICFAFPKVLLRDDVDLLLQDLEAFFVAHGVASETDADVDKFLTICDKIRVFYELGSAEGSIGQLLGANKWVILDLTKEELKNRLGSFAKLGMMKEDLGKFLLKHSREIFNPDLDNTMISIPHYLFKIGLKETEVKWLIKEYPFIIGQNKLGNVPAIMSIIGLSDWFLDETLKNNDLKFLSAEFVSEDSNYDLGIEEKFANALEKQKLNRYAEYLDKKIDFLQYLGFGTNKFMPRKAAVINGTNEQLQERFNCLLEMGIEYSKLCKMVNSTPKLLNQSKESIIEKANFLCKDLGYDLDCLAQFPAFLIFDLENRVKPRYEILNWLRENGLLKKPVFAPATVLANSEKRFIVNLYEIHPCAPKQWLEKFSRKRLHRH